MGRITHAASRARNKNTPALPYRVTALLSRIMVYFDSVSRLRTLLVPQIRTVFIEILLFGKASYYFNAPSDLPRDENKLVKLAKDVPAEPTRPAPP